jgi:hypothetical protein
MRRTRRVQRQNRVLTAPEPNGPLFAVLVRLPTAPALPPGEKGDFGTSPIYGQLSDKLLLALSILTWGARYEAQ